MPPAHATASPPDPAALRRAYREETSATLGRRLWLGALLYLSCVAAAVVLEYQHHPERGDLRFRLWLLELTAWVGAAAACGLPAIRRWTAALGAVLMGLTVLLLLYYNVLVGAPAERCVMYQTCFVMAVAVLMQWGWRPQLLVAATSLGGFWLVGDRLPVTDALPYTVVGLVAAAVTSVGGAFFFDRYRWEAFVRAALLERAHAVQEEEAEIAAALLRVGQELDANLGAPDMLERVNRLAVGILGCDACGTFIWDEAAGAFRLAASAGTAPAVHAEIADIDFTAEMLPVVTLLRAGRPLEIATADGQDLVPPDLLRRWETASVLYTPLVRRNQTIGLVTYSHRTRTGPFSAKERRLADGIAHATTIALENARLIADLQAASRLKSDFVATMSHELRTPLNVITGYTELITQGAFGPLPHALEDTIARIRRSALELFDLVNATLDLGRLETGRDAPALAPVAVGDVLREVAREVETLVAPGVDLELDAAIAEPVLTDRLKLKTIVKNLAGNAVKFTVQGRVTVSARHADGTLTVRVADTGVGIPADGLPFIFDMFRQLDGSPTRRFGGVGLGLYIVKRLTTLLGGTVEVESRPGEGSTFTVRIPARGADDATGRAGAAIVTRPAAASSGGIRAGT